MRRVLLPSLLVAVVIGGVAVAQSLFDWVREFPKTDFSRAAIELSEIGFDGARRDSIPPVRDPRYVPLDQAAGIGAYEPVIAVEINDDARAYPLCIMLFHEIVNEVIGGVPVVVTYCPLCNSGVVYDRRTAQGELTFGNTGRLRHFDMVMYDHQTESWWQQFSGEAIVGTLTGTRLEPLPSRVEGLASFAGRHPDGQVLVPENARARRYGLTPYAGMERRGTPPGFDRYALPEGLDALDYVVVVGKDAWPLDRLREAGQIEHDGVVLTWEAGRNSLHDTRTISEGRDMGNVVVTDGQGRDLAHDVVFAFAFAAFLPDGTWHMR